MFLYGLGAKSGFCIYIIFNDKFIEMYYNSNKFNIKYILLKCTVLCFLVYSLYTLYIVYTQVNITVI